MKQFIHTLILWLLGLFALFLCIDFILNRHKHELGYLIGRETNIALFNSKKKAGSSILVIGDSVCNQIYPSNKNYTNLTSLACNRAISMAGYFFLFKNYLSVNYDCPPKTLVLFLNPASVQNQLDKFAYHYFLKNYLTKDYYPDYNDELWEQVHKIPYYWSAPLPFIRVSNFSPDYSITNGNSDYYLFSPIACTYLDKIIRLAKEYSIDIVFRCTPIDFNNQAQIVESFNNSLKAKEIPSPYLEDYIHSVRFVKDSIIDGVHFKIDCIPQDYLNLL